MKIVISKKDGIELWHKLPKRRNPDIDLEMWRQGKGEFSLAYQQGFEKHLKHYDELNSQPYYQNMNGGRVKAILKENPLWL